MDIEVLDYQLCPSISDNVYICVCVHVTPSNSIPVMQQ